MFRIGVVFLLLFLSSCRVGEEHTINDYIPDNTVQKNLNLSDNPLPVSPTWYNIFNDKDLNTLLTFALKNNFTILQGVERLKQSRYTLQIHRADFLPMFDAAGNYDLSKANSYPNSLDNSNNFKVGFDAAWELDIWGKSNYVSEQYEQLMRQTEYSLLNIHASIIAEVVTNYVQLRAAQKVLEITRKNLSLQQDILQMVQDKYNAGIADDLALNQAAFVVESTKSNIPDIIKQIEEQKNALAVLLGVVPTDIPVNLDKFDKNIVSNTFKYSVKDLYKLPLNILRTRPDVAEAEAKVYAQNATLNTAITELYPSINLSAAFGYLSHSGKQLFNSDAQVYSYSPAINVPIWHWKQLTNNIEIQKHIKSEYLLNYNETLLLALTELKNSIFSVEQAYTTNKHKNSSFVKMNNIMDLTKEKYKNGLINFTDVANAEQNLLSAQKELIESNASILLYLTAFYKATGGGYNFKD